MIDPITALEALSNAKSLLDLVMGISRYVKRKSAVIGLSASEAKTPAEDEKLQALDVTLEEWKHIAVMVVPEIGKELRRYDTASLYERAGVLAELVKQYGAAEINASRSDIDHILLRHTAVARTQEGTLQLHLGRSKQTRYLQGEVVDIVNSGKAEVPNGLIDSSEPIGGTMQLPIFKVTMLGDSGVGKTVFMSSMYAKLREGQRGIAIRAVSNDIDLELDTIMRGIYAQKKWPPGTDVNEKKYDFELLLGENAIAQIDWVDYRGGALLESDTEEGGSALTKRLQESHSIIWMIDMNQLIGCNVNSTPARLMTGVGRMAQLCRQAIKGNNNLRSILFVRTKADEVLDDSGKLDLVKACEQLIEHLGHDNFSDIPCAAAIPVSSVGRVSGDKKPVGDNPSNVEWPLILSLAILLETELRKLDSVATEAHEELVKARPGKVVEFFKRTLLLGPNPEEIQAKQSVDELTQQIMGISEVIKQLIKDCPRSIRTF